MKELNLLKYNRHWEEGYRYPYPKKREVFSLLLETLEKRQIVELIGLRRTGKTTLLFQIINFLIQNKVNPFSIWYFNFDEEKISLDELFHNFSKQTELDIKKEKIYIFLDEIQKLPNFQNMIKPYYDLYPNLKFFISGSTSLFIKKKTQESLAGRVISFHLLPLNFKEFLYFKDKTKIIDKQFVFREEIEKEFELFLKSQFIETIFMKEEEKKEYLISLMKKIVFEDIPQIFPVENPEVLWSLIKIIAQSPGILIDYQSLSKEIGISNKTISSYLFYLEEAFLIRKIYNFSRNLITSEKKLKKFYLASTSFSWAISEFIETAKLVENLVICLKNFKFFWRDVYKHEVDFIDIKQDKIIPIEVKYKEKILEKEMKNLLIFSNKFKIKEAILLKKNFEEMKKKIGYLEIREIPIYFLTSI